MSKMEFNLLSIDSFRKALRRPNSYKIPEECRRGAVLLPALWLLLQIGWAIL